MMSERKLFSTFSVDQALYGVEVERVQEVLRGQSLTTVPLAPAVIGGLMNLRGNIITAIDMRRRLRLAECPDGQSPMSIVLRTDGAPVSLLVDEIGDVEEVNDESFEPPPGTLPEEHRSLITGVYKLKKRLLLVLNTDEVLNTKATGQ